MNYFEQLVDKKTFSFNDLFNMVGNMTSTKELISKYLRKGYISRVKKNLYVANNLETKEPIVNKFMIASRIADDSVVSGLSALEYYGYYNQVRNDVFVMSETRFRNFEFNGVNYKRSNLKLKSGIDKINKFLTITDLERSLIDVIKDLNKFVNLEEINNILELIPGLNEDKIKKYLDQYNIQYLYQKVGYLLENYKEELNLSKEFFDYLKIKIKTKRYLVNNATSVVYNNEWKLIVPIKKGGGYGLY